MTRANAILLLLMVSAALTFGPEALLALTGGQGALPLPEPSNIAFVLTGALLVAFSFTRRSHTGK